MVKIYNLWLIAESEETKSCFEFYLIVYHESEKGFNPNIKWFCFLLPFFLVLWESCTLKKGFHVNCNLVQENMTLTCRSRRSAVDRTGTNLGRGTFMATPPSKNCTGSREYRYHTLERATTKDFFMASILHPWSCSILTMGTNNWSHWTWPLMKVIEFIHFGWGLTRLISTREEGWTRT